MDAANRHLETRSVERLAGGKDHRRRPDGSCGIAIMAKASAPGRTKTRLVPPLTFEQAAALNTAFLQDITGNLLLAGSHAAIAGYVAFAPAGTKAFFHDTLPHGIGLIDACLPTLGDCLLRTLQEIFGRGHASAVVINSDSPTLPTALLVETANMLAQPGERAVLGPSTDGGYYLLGLKTVYRRLFEDIIWGTERVAAQTLERARELKLDVHMLPPWYDVDDVEGLRRLHGELGSARPSEAKLDTRTPYYPVATANLLRSSTAGAWIANEPKSISQNPPGERLMQVDKAKLSVDPRRYFEGVRTDSDRPAYDPVCLYLETTNRCNLLCTTCPRTYEALEPPADMSWQLFCSIVDQIPNLSRAVLHGVGEPMLVKNLPRMVRYLKDRGTYVLFNTNGTVLNEKNGRALIEAGLDELRVSFDAANAESYKAIRGKNYFNRILRNVHAFRELQEREGHSQPRVSAWFTGLRETVEQLPDFVRVAAESGVREVYLQRLVFFEENAIGKAREDQALYEQLSREDASHIDRAADIAASLGMRFSASGAASEPGMSLKRTDGGSPWSLCRRPWTVMYITANGRALPCCIAPFSQRGYEHYTLGDATQQALRDIWQGPAYQAFRRGLKSDKPPTTCANCGLRWSL